MAALQQLGEHLVLALELVRQERDPAISAIRGAPGACLNRRGPTDVSRERLLPSTHDPTLPPSTDELV
jgi:hypothetical protein